MKCHFVCPSQPEGENDISFLLLHVNHCIWICSHGGDGVFWATLQQWAATVWSKFMCLYDRLDYVSFYEKTFPLTCGGISHCTQVPEYLI